MTDPENNLIVQISCDDSDLDVDFDKLKKLTRRICHNFSVRNATVSIAVLDDAAIKKVNAEFLGKTTRTDVISFDLSDEGCSEKTFELVINADQARRQAKQRNHSPEAELALYITHGLLHNLGYSDENAEQARKMHETEDRILQQEGFGVIYNKPFQSVKDK